jgi:sarcosine oxidase, subunit gamma
VTADLRISALAHRAADLAAASGPAVTLAELPFRSMTNVRTSPDGGGAWPAANRVTGDPDGRTVLWLGPDEFLVVAPDGAAVPDLPGTRSVVDVGANRTTLELSGDRAREVLEKAVTLDLHPRAFAPGHCAQTTFARTHTILWQTAPASYRLLFRPSFADYLADWLIDAVQEFTA